MVSGSNALTVGSNIKVGSNALTVGSNIKVGSNALTVAHSNNLSVGICFNDINQRLVVTLRLVATH